MKLNLKSKETTRFLKFLVVGAIGAVVDFGTLNLLNYFTEIPFVYRQAISFVLAVINNFLWNRYWTYPDSRSKPLGRQLAQFFLINGVGIVIRTLIIPVTKNILNAILQPLLGGVQLPFSEFLTVDVIAENLSVVVVIFIVLLWNFFANRYWTYNDVDKEDSIEEKSTVIETNE
jgi:putative flippase GtrA